MLIDLWSVSCKVWEGIVQLILTCVNVFWHLFMGVGLKEWHYSIHVQVIKSLAYVWDLNFNWQRTQFCRALALQPLIEHLSMNWCKLGLKVPTSLNWVKFMPGICDGWATLSTGWELWDRRPTQWCLGLAPMRVSNLQMCVASLAPQVIWEESLSIMLVFNRG